MLPTQQTHAYRPTSYDALPRRAECSTRHVDAASERQSRPTTARVEVATDGHEGAVATAIKRLTSNAAHRQIEFSPLYPCAAKQHCRSQRTKMPCALSATCPPPPTLDTTSAHTECTSINHPYPTRFALIKNYAHKKLSLLIQQTYFFFSANPNAALSSPREDRSRSFSNPFHNHNVIYSHAGHRVLRCQGRHDSPHQEAKLRRHRS